MRMPRSTTCRAVLVTSIVWLLVDVIILIHYIDPSSNSNRVSRADRVSRQLMPGEAAPAAEGKKGEEEELKERAPIDYMRHADPDTIEEMNKMMDMDAFRGSSQGSDGNGVVLPDSLKDEQTRRFKENQFNVLASEHISVNRTLRDYRNPGCLARASSINIASLPKTSIIIVFHNEAWSTLLRTLHSVVNRSPHSLVEEIILIDDLSDRDYLKKPLDLYIKRFPIPTQLIHLPERSGLIRARLTGSGKAKGDVLLFLDAHVEVTEGWLEPLLERVKEDRTRVVAPIIDVISDDTFEYVTASDTTWGGFNWRMNFRWYPVPKREMIRRNNDHSNVIKTPTIAGGLFAIDKKYFYEIGSYDEGMEVWGGENLEISFRVWMCGGSLEIHPCSRVGHVFRKQTPYSFPGGTAKVIHHNSARTAEVWMDDYKEFFFKTVPAARALAGDTTERKKLRTDLKCKSFDWYLRTIYPEAPVPADYRSIGAVSNGAGLCLDTFSRKAGELVGMSACHEAGGNQVFSMTGSGEVRADDLCLSASGGTFDVGGKVRLEKCSVVKTLAKHEFEYTEASGHLKHRKSGYCLSATGDSVTLSACSDAPAQKWTLDDYVELEQ